MNTYHSTFGSPRHSLGSFLLLTSTPMWHNHLVSSSTAASVRRSSDMRVSSGFHLLHRTEFNFISTMAVPSSSVLASRIFFRSCSVAAAIWLCLLHLAFGPILFLFLGGIVTMTVKLGRLEEEESSDQKKFLSILSILPIDDVISIIDYCWCAHV